MHIVDSLGSCSSLPRSPSTCGIQTPTPATLRRFLHCHLADMSLYHGTSVLDVELNTRDITRCGPPPFTPREHTVRAAPGSFRSRVEWGARARHSCYLGRNQLQAICSTRVAAAKGPGQLTGPPTVSGYMEAGQATRPRPQCSPLQSIKPVGVQWNLMDHHGVLQSVTASHGCPWTWLQFWSRPSQGCATAVGHGRPQASCRLE